MDHDITPEGTAYDVSGPGSTGDTIVLVHGVGLDRTMWDLQMAALAPKYRVVRYDLLGHGQSADQPISDIRTFIDQLEELLSSLSIDRFHLIGLSMGGVIAQGFAGRHSDRLKTMILMNTVYRRDTTELTGMRSRLALTREQGLGPVADAALSRWFDSAFRAAFPERVAIIRQKMLSNRLEPYIAAYSALIDADTIIQDALTQVTCPTLVIAGEHDPGSTPDIARRMVADLRQGELLILPGLHHLTPWEAPELVSETILDFLEAHGHVDS
ncbi:MAG: alpha/beta fold hydrolase [Arenicellales bacterium]